MQSFKQNILLLIKRYGISMKIDVNIDACKQGEREALGNLYKAYSDRLKRVCLHYVDDESMAEDILHDAFIIIFTSIKSLKDNSKLEGWMITIVRNLSLRFLQSTEKSNILLSSLGKDLLSEEDDKEKNIELELLLSAIELLPEGNREIFKLSVLDGLSHKEIGDMLGINPHSSSSQLARAKKMLRVILIKYWMLFLLPILIPVYIYFVTRDKFVDTSDNRSMALDTHHNFPKRVQQNRAASQKNGQPRYSIPSSATENDRRVLAEKTLSTEDISSQIITDSVESEQQPVFFHVDSLPKYLATGEISIDDSVLRIPQISEEKMLASNESMKVDVNHKKKYTWKINFGYSSNTSGNTISNFNYLSVIDYANGGVAAKLYTWTDLENYYTRNNALMDSVERARMSLILREHPTDGNSSLGEVAHHSRPKTFGLSINKQLSPKWTFGTGITYTRLKSEFESEYNRARLVKTQKIDYVGIPLRLTYQVWSKGRFNAYMTGGMALEMPVHSSLEKKYIITADSLFTLKGDIKPRYQWSVNLGIGVQYKLFKPFSLYIEPNMFYYFRNGSSLETYRTEHPFIITVPFGLRLTW